jgi:hypothetical protein
LPQKPDTLATVLTKSGFAFFAKALRGPPHIILPRVEILALVPEIVLVIEPNLTGDLFDETLSA